MSILRKTNVKRLEMYDASKKQKYELYISDKESLTRLYDWMLYCKYFSHRERPKFNSNSAEQAMLVVKHNSVMRIMILNDDTYRNCLKEDLVLKTEKLTLKEALQIRY